MAMVPKMKRVNRCSHPFESEETRGRISSASSSLQSQVIDEEENVAWRGPDPKIRRRLSFGSNTSGCSTTSSNLLSRDWRSGRLANPTKSRPFDAENQSSASSNRRVVVENLAEVWVQQQEAAEGGGGGKRWLETVVEKLSNTEEQLDILELDGMELFDHDEDLALALLSDPDSFATELMDHILLLLSSCELWKSRCSSSPVADGPPARGSRLWIRFISVPLPLLPLHALERRCSEITCTNNGTAKQLVYVYGVVYAISNIRRRIFRQRYVCKLCKNSYDAYHSCGLSLPPGCCQTWIREDIESHDYLPHQEILLGPVPNVAMPSGDLAAKQMFGQMVVAVSLFDDLTGRLELGDSVAIIGHAAMQAASTANSNLNVGSLTPSGYRFAEVCISANNIFTPFKLNSLKVMVIPTLQQTSQAFRTKDGQVSLERLCNAICSHGPGAQLWPKLLPIALLLSLVASDSSDCDLQRKPISIMYPLLDGSNPALQGDLSSRKQIHILLATKSCSSANSLQSLLATTLYASRSMYAAKGNATLVAKIKQEDASKDKQMLYAGCLALSKGGVLVLDLSVLTKSKVRNLCEAMGKKPVNLQQRRPQQISGSLTVWGFSHEVSNGYGTWSNWPKASSPVYPGLLRAFDIILEEPIDMLSDSQVLQNLIVELNESSTSSSVLSADLQQHLLAASSICSMGITAKAHELLCTYYLALRRNKEYSDCTSEQPDDVSLLTLESLLRVAEACAKLCWRSEIQEIPDATLAILLCESSHLTKFGRSFVRDHLVISSDNKHDSSTAFSRFREGTLEQELCDFHSNLMSCLCH